MSRHVRYSLKLLPFVGGVFLVILLNRLEHWFMPVVKDFTVARIERQERTLTITGYMRKVRSCQFAGVTAEGFASGTPDVIDLPLKFRDNPYDETATRPVGTQGWGPWQIDIPALPNVHTVTLTSVHSCHPAWASQTELVTIPVVQFMQGTP